MPSGRLHHEKIHTDVKIKITNLLNGVQIVVKSKNFTNTRIKLRYSMF